MRRARLLAAATASVLALTGVGAIAQDAGELDEVKSRLNQIAQEIEQAEQAEQAADAELEQATERLREVEAIVNDLAIQLEQQQARVTDAEDRLQELRDRAAKVQAAFEARTVELFKRSYGSDIDAVLSSGNIQEALDRRTLIEQVNESDRATLEQVRAAEGAVQTQQEVLDAEVERLEQVKAEQEEVLEQVRQIRQSKAMAAAAAEDRVDELQHEHEDLEEERERIKELIEQRQAPQPSIASPSSGITQAASGAGYVWPACGTVTSEYGRRWGRAHEGIDIDDNYSSAIYAARSGVVIYAGWQGGYGQMTMIDHGNGVVTAYAHQAAMMVSRGQSVSTGQRIGTIGTTGASTGTHLHFEVRVNGAPQNPRGYLSGGC